MGSHKLFHAVVVMGVSAAAGCASHERGPFDRALPDRNEDAGVDAGIDAGAPAPVGTVITLADAGSAPSGEPWPSSCQYRYQYVCDSYAPLSGCRCDPSRPRSSDDCGGLAKTHCQAAFCAPDELCQPAADGTPFDFYVDCQCVPAAPTTPEECDGPGQFVCTDMTLRRDCRCDPSRPKTPEDCAHPEYFHCAYVGGGGTYADCACTGGDLAEDCLFDTHLACQSETPLFGCECQATGIK